MNLEKQLRQAASEARHATARRRGASIEAVAGGARSLRVVVFVAAAAVVLVAVGASTLVLTKPPGEVLVPVGTNPIDERPGTTVASEPPTTAPGVTTSRAPILDGDGLSGADLLSSRWIAATAENGMILLMEDGIGLGVARGIKPGSGYQLIAPSTRDHDVLIQLGPDDGNLPSVAVGFAAGNGDPIVKVFGIVPAHTVAVELDFGGGELIVINRIFDRPEVERSVFIGAVPESSLVAAEPGSMVLSATDSAGLVTSLAFAGDNVRATAIVRDSYTGALTLRTFQPEPLLIVDSVAVSAIPDLVGCLTFDGVIPPSNQGAIVNESDPTGSPGAALEAFLAEPRGDPPLATFGYLEMTTPSGPVVYGYDAGVGFAAFIYVTARDGGWVVERWEGSGC